MATAGSEKLKKCLEERKAKAGLAKKLDVSPDVVSRWVTGERTPTPLHRAALQDEYQIDWRSWDHEPGWEPPEVAPGPEAFPASGAPSGS